MQVEIGKKYTRGKRMGQRYKDIIEVESYPEGVYSFLFDIAKQYDRKYCDYVVEWHKAK
jgi:hypothetical protein